MSGKTDHMFSIQVSDHFVQAPIFPPRGWTDGGMVVDVYFLYRGSACPTLVNDYGIPMPLHRVKPPIVSVLPNVTDLRGFVCVLQFSSSNEHCLVRVHVLCFPNCCRHSINVAFLTPRSTSFLCLKMGSRTEAI